ncbi:MAG: AMP-binding protein, partial [Verrucomicrobia bacterium]|nr:AMP-binding protein [Verrucomicrobiota bacterium]
AGVRPGDLVGIAPERRIEFPVALLGILKAGAAYVPLDAAYPLDRLEFMVADTGIQILIGEFAALTSRIPDCITIPWDAGRGMLCDKLPAGLGGGTGLCDVHFWFDWSAKGYGDPASGGGAPGNRTEFHGSRSG